MSFNRQAYSKAAEVPIQQNTETDLLGDSMGINASECTSLLIGLQNVGPGFVEKITVYVSPLGIKFFPLGMNYGPMTASSMRLIDLSEFTGMGIRLTATSPSGSTLYVEARGTRLDS